MKAKQTLDDQIRSHYEQQQLPAAMVDEIRLLRGKALRPPHQQWRRWATAAAVIIVMIGAIASLRTFQGATDPARDLAEIAARDHNRRLDVEVTASDYGELQTRLANLGFNPVKPQKLAGMPMQMTGARYSTIDGSAAVQIKLVEPGGNICTLIQLRPGDGMKAINAPRQFMIDGLAVDVWTEKGLVMALARTT